MYLTADLEPVGPFSKDRHVAYCNHRVNKDLSSDCVTRNIFGTRTVLIALPGSEPGGD